MRILQVLNDAARQRIKYENIPLLAGGGKDLSVGAELQVKYSAWKGNDYVIEIRAQIMSRQDKSDQILI
jgi:hypothetical protein